MFSIIGSAIKFLAKPVSKLVMSIPKGNATGVASVITAVAGATAVGAPHWFTDPNLATNIRAVAELVAAIGTAAAGIGIGRHEAMK